MQRGDAHEGWLAAAGRSLFRHGPVQALGLLVAVGLKEHYRTASVEQLRWMLAPLAWLVGGVTGIPFAWEAQTGYVSTSAGISLVPACAGINFLVVCFVALFLTLVHRLRSGRARLAWLLLAGGASWAITLWANTVRIASSIYLARADLQGAWVTPERVHRLDGIVIYLGFLLAAYLAAERLTRPRLRLRRPLASAARVLSVPFACYLLVTVLIPFLNAGGLRREPLFVEHVVVVLAVSAFLFAACFCCAVLYQGAVDTPGSESEHRRVRLRRPAEPPAISRQEAETRC